MACGFRAELLRSAARRRRAGRARRSRYVEESEPLGTAGPLRLAADQGLLADRFLALNGDVLTDLDLSELIAAHERNEAHGHDRALSRRRSDRLRPGQPRGRARRRRAPLPRRPGGAVDGVPGEARARPRSRPTRSTPAPTCSSGRCSTWSRPARRSRSSGRYSRAWSGRGYTVSAWRATGWTSAHPSATCRRAGTSSSAASRPTSRRLLDPAGLSVSEDAEVDAGAQVSPPALVEAGCTVAAGARVGPHAVLGASARSAPAAEIAGLGARQPLPRRRGRDGRRLDPRRGGRRRRRRDGRPTAAWSARRAAIAPGERLAPESRVAPGGAGRVSELPRPRPRARQRQPGRRRPRPSRPPARRALALRVRGRSSPRSPAGLVACGMGGSGVGGALARAALGDRTQKPMMVVRGYEPADLDPEELRRALLELFGRNRGDPRLLRRGRGRRRAAHRRHDRRAARRAGPRRRRARRRHPVRDCSRAPPSDTCSRSRPTPPRSSASPRRSTPRSTPPRPGSSSHRTRWSRAPPRSPTEVEGSVPVMYGSDLTAPVSYRWKTQVNENAKQPAFHAELPEMAHNEIVGWDAALERGPASRRSSSRTPTSTRASTSASPRPPR